LHENTSTKKSDNEGEDNSEGLVRIVMKQTSFSAVVESVLARVVYAKSSFSLSACHCQGYVLLDIIFFTKIKKNKKIFT
jgi:hypothetical protein